MLIGVLLFSQLASACASTDVKAQSGWGTHLLAVARVESGLNPLAIYDNTSGAALQPTSFDVAVRIADRLINDEGHKVDLGLMQIDSANFMSLGLSIPDAFDPCHSIAAGSHLLMDGYRRAMRAAYSEYNTGSPTRGLSYAAKVEAAVGNLTDSAFPEKTADLDTPQQSCAPSWDVWATATCGGPATPSSAPSTGVVSVSLNNSGGHE